MDAGVWASSVSAGVAVVSAVGSAAAWWRSRQSRVEATRQAARSVEAAERAAGAVERLAAVQEGQVAQATARADAEEQSPWVLLPIPGGGNCWLRNTTLTPKYGVQIQGTKVDEPCQFPLIQGKQKVTVGVHRILHPDDRVTVTWHREQNLSDEPFEWQDDLPPRV